MKGFWLFAFLSFSFLFLFISPNTSHAQYCPDGLCNGVETCSTCPADCGVCGPPVCTSVTADPPALPAGSSTTVTARCPGGSAYTWPDPVTVPPGGPSGSNSDGPTNTTTYNTPPAAGPPVICSDITVNQSVQVSNGFGSNTYSTDITVTPNNKLSGTVYVDTAGNDCASGATPYGGGARVTVWNDSTNEASDITNLTGSPPVGFYSLYDTKTCDIKDAVISSLPLGYKVDKIKYQEYQGGAWVGTSDFTYNFNFSGDRTLDWCISNAVTTWQTGDGDVRLGNSLTFGALGKLASNNPDAAFFFSNFTHPFNAGDSKPGYVINDEYSYNDDPKTKQGLFSYTFFINRAKIKAVTVNPMPGCPIDGSPCTKDITNFATGIYRTSGDLTLTSYSHAVSGSPHVLILVNGTATIKSNIKVPSDVGNLFVLAAKININIDPSVGTSPPVGSPTSNIEGIYTAEGSINLQGTKCSTGSNPDKQFTLAGNFIANSLRPFKVGGAGMFNNNRSLCSGVGGDLTYPVFVIQSRYDFIPQLTDFYKAPLIRWKEVNP